MHLHPDNNIDIWICLCNPLLVHVQIQRHIARMKYTYMHTHVHVHFLFFLRALDREAACPRSTRAPPSAEAPRAEYA